MKRIIIIIIAIASLSVCSYAQTTIPAGNVNGTWTAENSPYQITGDINVPTGETLSIEPGVKVEFMGWYELVVNGELKAIGSSDKLIHFTTNDTANFFSQQKGWKGIDWWGNENSDTSIIRNCKLDYIRIKGEIGGIIDARYYNYLIIENSSLSKSRLEVKKSIYYGEVIYATHTKILIKNNTIQYNQLGSSISIEYADFVEISGNKIYNNNGGVVLGNDNYNPNIVNNIICNNHSGLYLGYYNGSALIANNTICNNYMDQLSITESRIETNLYNNIISDNINDNRRYSIFFEWSISSFYNCNIMVDTIIGTPSIYQNIIESDPLFVNPTQGDGVAYDASKADWGLQPGSPCINAGIAPDSLNLPETDINGNPRIYNNIIDIGAIEYNDTIISVKDKKNSVDLNNHFVVYPNPVSTILNLYSEKLSGDISIEILTLTGKKVFSKKLNNTNGLNEPINVKALNKGVYLVKTICNNKVYAKKIIVE